MNIEIQVENSVRQYCYDYRIIYSRTNAKNGLEAKDILIIAAPTLLKLHQAHIQIGQGRSAKTGGVQVEVQAFKPSLWKTDHLLFEDESMVYGPIRCRENIVNS